MKSMRKKYSLFCIRHGAKSLKHADLLFKKTDVFRLSYLQLVRINSFIDANGVAEQKEAKRFVGSLTPTERRIINRYSALPTNSPYKLAVKNMLQKELHEKNAAETKTIDSKQLIANLEEKE